MRLVQKIVMVAAAAAVMAQEVPENVYRGELISYPGPWQFQVRRSGIILVTDQELETLATDPDKVINISTGRAPRNESLRQICERAKAQGQRTLMLAFDHFFRQYRPGQDTPRRLMPDMDEYIQKIASIGKFAQGYGLNLELSLLSPLELGKAYEKATGESGIWMHYREGLRDPKTGAFSVQLWRQQFWANNKGVVAIEDAGVRVFAFREAPLPESKVREVDPAARTPYHVVDPSSIVEIKDGVQVDAMEGVVARSGDFRAIRIRVHGRSPAGRDDLDRVLVVQMYRTPEMDYFSPKALPFLKDLIDRYYAAGVRLNALYSDEMHIQQDWGYFRHHDHGEFALRYVSQGLMNEYASRYGEQYRDFAKFLLYFAHGQEDFTPDLTAKQGMMHVFGASPEQIRQTALFRARYYKLLQNGVVDLFVKGKHYAEQKMGYKLEARAHATWAQSPTIDFWETGKENHHRSKYEYTSNFVWSNTVQQASSACYDYFKWGDFLTGNGNDTTEGGFLDRNYYAMALAASIGILNEVPYAYAAHWGMPAEISKRRTALVNTFGASSTQPYAIVQDSQHRDADVLLLYPLDLVAVEERFGSWMTQYAYANYVTAEKLLERGKVNGKAVEMAGRRFTTLAALFEPFPPRKLLEMMQQFAANGGRVIWSGPPPVLTFEGEPALEMWQSIFGVDYRAEQDEGVIVPGRMVKFEGALAKVPPQTILTDFLVDRVYPVTPRAGTSVVARVKGWVSGTQRGSATFLGFRPRDDQSLSMGYDVRTWFEVLRALGAYPATGKPAGANDNTEYLSRTGKYLTCRFPNGAVAIAPHLKELEEDWPGGFARDVEADKAWLAKNPLPPDSFTLQAYRTNGHTVTYQGAHALSFRLDAKGELAAFAGQKCKEITVNGKRTVFADKEMAEVAWAPVAKERRVPGGAVLQIQVRGEGTMRIPAAGGLELIAEGATSGSRGAAVPSKTEAGALVFTVTKELSGKWIYGVAR